MSAPGSGVYAACLGEVDAKLGAPESDGPFGFRAALACDEAERLPEDVVSRLGALGLPLFQVPVADGGRLVSFEQIVAVAFALARRDPSLALTLGMQSWLWLLWIAGTPAQGQRARTMLRDGALPCLAASEAAHGADLLASETLAVRRGDSWELTGEKWPIGSAGRAATAFVLARTRPEPGPRSLSWFSVDLDQVGVTRLPRVRTHGLRAADVSGLRFVRAAAAPIGEEGQGLELTLKIFQITRPLMASIGLGTASTAIRVATRFAVGRRVYRGAASDLGAVRAALVGAWLDFVTAEVLLLSTARALHVAPDQMSVASAIAKTAAPWLLERAIGAAVVVLGARSFLREGDTGIVQKMVRDHVATALIDGSRPVCLHALAAELPQLFEVNRGSPARVRARLALDEPVPAFSADRLELTARGADDVTAALPPELAGRAEWLRAAGQRAPAGDRLDLAARYGLLHATACCAQFARWNGELEAVQAGAMAAACQRLTGSEPLDEAVSRALFDRLVDHVERGHILSITDRTDGTDGAAPRPVSFTAPMDEDRREHT